MNAKEEGVVTTLKHIAKAASRATEKAFDAGAIESAATAMITHKAAINAAEIIEKQSAELELLRAQPAHHFTTPNIGRHVRLKAMADSGAHIIVGESKSHFLITAISVNPTVKVSKAEVVFVN